MNRFERPGRERSVQSREWGAAAVAVIVGAVGLAYLSATGYPFQFDDYRVIVHNPDVHSWPAWLHSMPGIRPLLKLAYTLNWTSALGPWGFRLFNIACHAIGAVCVYLLCARWHGALGGPDGRARPIALTAALLFALHPAQTEAVTYISGRSVSLMGVCYLGALVAYPAGETHRPATRRHALSALLFAAAMLTKETAWTLPFALLLLEAGARRGGLRDALGRLSLHWAALGLTGAAMLATPGYRRLALGSLSVRSLRENLLTQIDGLWYLLTQPLLLLRINVDPALPVRAGLDADLAIKGGLLLGLAILGAATLRARPWMGAGILWLFLHLLPTNSVLPRLDVANDRQLYLAIIGPASLLSALLWTRAPRRMAVAVALCVGLGGATVLRNHDYRTEVALWQATARQSPNKARVWNNLGYAHQLAGEREAARQAYARALELDPEHLKARANAARLDSATDGEYGPAVSAR